MTLGAVDSTNSITVIINFLTSGLSVEIGIIIAHFLGLKKIKKLKILMVIFIYIVPLIALIMGILCFILGGLFLNLLHTPKDIFHME